MVPNYLIKINEKIVAPEKVLAEMLDVSLDVLAPAIRDWRLWTAHGNLPVALIGTKMRPRPEPLRFGQGRSAQV
jgi:hypothetical protein